MKVECRRCNKFMRTRSSIKYKGERFCTTCFLNKTHRIPIENTDILKKLASIEREIKNRKEYSKEYKQRPEVKKKSRDYQRKIKKIPKSKWRIKE